MTTNQWLITILINTLILGLLVIYDVNHPVIQTVTVVKKVPVYEKGAKVITRTIPFYKTVYKTPSNIVTNQDKYMELTQKAQAICQNQNDKLASFKIDSNGTPDFNCTPD